VIATVPTDTIRIEKAGSVSSATLNKPTTPVTIATDPVASPAMMKVREGEGVHVTAMTESDSLPVVEMPDGLPGFPDLRRFALFPLEDSGLVQELRSLEDDAVRFVVVPSVVFYPDYAPEIDDATARKLDLSEDSDTAPLVLLVVTVGDTLAESTVNLLAPVVINSATRVAAQVVLDDTSLALRAPLSL
jgi:flagellar assembly factor FliW